MADVQLSTLGSVIKTAYEGQANTNAYTDAEKTKVAGVETGATADQTDAEILAAVQSESGRTLATDGTKLDGIEANADVTDTANVTAAGAVMDSEVINLAAVKAFDPSDYAAASHGHTGGEVTIGTFTEGNAVVTDASGNLVDGGSPPGGSGTTNITIAESPTGVEVQSSSGTNDTIALANGTNAGAMSPAHYTKVEGVEAAADVTDTANVTAAGALMDSEVTNLAAVKAFDPADYATAAQGTTADSALQSVAAADISDATADGIALMTSADANPFTDADESKLDGIQVLSAPADADYFTQRNAANDGVEYARKSFALAAAIELTDGEVDIADLPACVITGGIAWVVGGASATVNIKIGGTSITGLSALSATTSKPGTYTSATAANVAALDDALSVALTSSSGSGRVEVRLKGYYKRVA